MSLSHDEMIAVIQHHRDGGKVQIADRGKGNFEDTLNPIWDFNEFDYRIKPEPRSLWRVNHENGNPAGVFDDECQAKAYSSSLSGATIHEYKEVLP